MSFEDEKRALQKVPELDFVVFDLDYTLWPFWVDTHVTPPFRKTSDGQVTDACGRKVKFYPEVPRVLKQLTEAGYQLGVASRTPAVDEAMHLLKLFGWEKYFTVFEIYPGSKVTHFNQLQKKTKIPFSKMLFFDDEYRNIKDLKAKGVVSILVKNGVDIDVVKDGIQEFVDIRSLCLSYAIAESASLKKCLLQSSLPSPTFAVNIQKFVICWKLTVAKYNQFKALPVSPSFSVNFDVDIESNQSLFIEVYGMDSTMRIPIVNLRNTTLDDAFNLTLLKTTIDQSLIPEDIHIKNESMIKKANSILCFQTFAVKPTMFTDTISYY